MYYRMIILALLFLVPEKSNSRILLFSPMEISDALPVQFWLIGCATYNEHRAAGVHHKCWCAPWQCDDIIPFQGKDIPGKNFSMLIFNDQEQQIGVLPIEETSPGVYELNYTPSSDSPGVCDELIQLKIQENPYDISVPVALPPLDEWQTTTWTPPTLAALVDWVNATGPNPGTWSLSSSPDISVNGNGGVSGYVAGAIATNAGFDYEFDVQFEIGVTGMSSPTSEVTFALLDAGFNELDTVVFNYVTAGVKNENFTLNGLSSGSYLAMRITNNTPIDTKNYELQSASYTPGVSPLDWVLGTNPSVNLPGAPLDVKQSELLFVDFAFVDGIEYTVEIDYSRVVNSGSSNPRTSTILILNSSDDIQFSANQSAVAGVNTISITFIANSDTTRIGYRHSSGSDVDITVTQAGASYQETVGGTEIIAKTDCLDIREVHEDTILLTFSNHRNFAGLVYEDASPAPEFQIRIPAIFFHQRFPEEDETMELSTSLVTLNGTLRKQRLMDIDYVPYYFHEKLKLILKHQLLEVFNRQWVKQEAYEILEGERRWPVKKAKCWISEKDFVHRNIL